ncbi:Methyl-CpG-binding domain-containing protein [Actinidia chinensis var. chinensis]|uniref:Methyl-CpG-binding domain-containing protein n=1 Tax=Actinidia chinensis var. chinensis TaxID=1590841 RepID=A0A2R6Q6B5_ACTCC|nr:Methyl-CpG-binding domain-containing protein [Actinidia chinensis var. chinensis]
MVTVATADAPLSSGQKLESLTHIDISQLSQSELHALSLCSAAAFDLRHTNDVVAPQIDRAFFNESAASRRQTYSRLRLSSRRRRLLPTLTDPEHAENKSIVNFLKHLIGHSEIENSQPRQFLLPPLPPQSGFTGNTDSVQPNCAKELQIVVYSGEKKRKRGRKSKPSDEEKGDEILEIVNKNGVVIDFRALENGDGLYGMELRRRSVGLESEEEVLGFLRNLDGEWGSRRKRRKIVDAGEFGDWLPIGWKLLLGLRRREGRVSIYCRRYVSPSGQQFVSCKEASSYLQSYFGLNDATQQLNQTADNNQHVHAVTSENHAGPGFPHKNGDLKKDSVHNSMLSSSSTPNLQEMELSLTGIDNLPEVQVRDLFECYKCNMTFDERDAYLNHLMSFHQRTTRRYRLGSSIGEGVIIKDGKYECQICHKVFQERRSYNGHVGIHVRSNVRSYEELPGQATVQKSTESPSQDGLPPQISKMDALIEIAQSSILETSTAEPNDKVNDGSSPQTLKVVAVPETHATNSDHELSFFSDPNEVELEDCMTKSIPDQGVDQRDDKCIMTDKEKVNGDKISHVENNLTVDCTGTFEHPKLNEVEKHGNCTREIGFGNIQLTQSHDIVPMTLVQTVKENILQSSITDSSMPMVVENNLSVFCTGTFEHTKPNEVEKHGNSEQEIGFGNSQPIHSLDMVPMTLVQNVKENVLQSSITDSSIPGVQSFNCFLSSTASSNKAGSEFFTVDQKLDNVTGFDELRLEEIEPLKFSFVDGQELPPLPEVSLNMANDEAKEEGFNSSARFESEAAMLNIVGTHQFTTVCVWCRIEFDHEAVDFEIQSDSVGFMCPTCKAKISGQLNVLDSGLSMNFHL